MKRRTVLQAGLGLALLTPLRAAMKDHKWDAATEVLKQATASGQVEAASLYARHGDIVLNEAFGKAKYAEAIFLLASISKPMSTAAVMTLHDQGLFDLDDQVRKFIPEFTGNGRDDVTMRHLFTHVSGLPDQLPENSKLRARHAELGEFIQEAIGTPLLFTPGSQYRYSSMAILLASEAARRISGTAFTTLVDETVFQPLNMKHSALGVGDLQRESLMRCQVENAAPESGSGEPTAKDWDWNSNYWRELGSPWGGVHGSAADVARFLETFLHHQGEILRPETARLMITNQNPPGVRPRGLGFDLGSGLGGPASDTTFGHGGSTGTLCWADPPSDAVFVVLTTLPAGAVDPHPRNLASKAVAEAVG